MKKLFAQFIRDDQGQDLIEYALLAGFISLAAVIFGNWNPFGAFGASLIFGFADTLQGNLAILRVPIPSQFLLMAPYIATMIALAGLVGRATPPAADGQPYEKH